MSDSRLGEQHGAPEGRSAAEWTTFAISAAILVAIIGMITWLSFRGAEEPPIIVAEARLDQARVDGGSWYVPIEVVNEGDRTVEEVTIEAELAGAADQPETAEFTVTFLAGGERATGTAIFSSDPTSGDLSVRPVSYTSP